ncbi:MAG: hypothetical protein GY788_25200 [bacterium]|nr:hypothetical protein [bacterium]
MFDPFGDPTASSGTTDPTIGFQGDHTDPASNEVWMGARWYNGADAAFRSRDTVFGELATPISLNRYTYGWASPLNYWDPDGHYIDEPGDVRKDSDGGYTYVGDGYTKAERANSTQGSFLSTSYMEAAQTALAQARAQNNAWLYQDWFNQILAGEEASFPRPASGEVLLSIVVRDGLFPDDQIMTIYNQHGLILSELIYDSWSLSASDMTREARQSGSDADRQYAEYLRLCEYGEMYCVGASHILYFGSDLDAAEAAADQAASLAFDYLSNRHVGGMLDSGAAPVDGFGEFAIDMLSFYGVSKLMSLARAGAATTAETVGTSNASAWEWSLSSDTQAAMRAGRASEAEILANRGLTKLTETWRPSQEQIESTLFRVVVGEPNYTRTGLPVGTIPDAAGTEIKSGSSLMGSSYQMRLQTFRSIVTGEPLTILTTRPVNPTFMDYLTRWAVKVEAP